jgi:hypothetical protein
MSKCPAKIYQCLGKCAASIFRTVREKNKEKEERSSKYINSL